MAQMVVTGKDADGLHYKDGEKRPHLRYILEVETRGHPYGLDVEDGRKREREGNS